MLVGQFAGDFARGRTLAEWPLEVAVGIRLHRHVDAFTDAFAGVQALRAEFDPRLRRYAGIALDVALDQALASNWSVFGEASTGGTLQAHVARVDAVLQRAASQARTNGTAWPLALERLRLALDERDLFHRWATDDGVQDTLLRLAARGPGLAPLARCGPELARMKPAIVDVASTLMPALRHSSAARLAALRSDVERHQTVTSER